MSGLFDAGHDVHQTVHDDLVPFAQVWVGGLCSEASAIDFVFFTGGRVIDLKVRLVVDGEVDDSANEGASRRLKGHG